MNAPACPDYPACPNDTGSNDGIAGGGCATSPDTSSNVGVALAGAFIGIALIRRRRRR